MYYSLDPAGTEPHALGCMHLLLKNFLISLVFHVGISPTQALLFLLGFSQRSAYFLFATCYFLNRKKVYGYFVILFIF